MNDLVSIVMPAYNAARHIAETIASVQAQTHAHWELIVVDDGSIDETRALVASHVAQDQRIKYVYQDNARQGRARNNGIAHATGHYIAFLDSDDLWVPEKLAVQVPILAASEADLVFSDAYMFRDGIELASIPTNQPKMNTVRGTFAGDEGLTLFLAGNKIPILTVLCKRAVLEAVGGFSENPLVQNAEDYHLWMKMLLSGFTLSGLNCTLAAYRQHSDSISDSDGQNLKQVIEAKVDLGAAYPEKKKLIDASLKHTIVLALEHIDKYRSADFYATIDRYLQLAGKNMWQPLFAGFQKAQARRLALKSIYFVFNYL